MGLVSYTHPDFWTFYNKLPKKVQNLANEKFELFKQNPNHPSLEFAKKAMSGQLILAYIIELLDTKNTTTLFGSG